MKLNFPARGRNKRKQGIKAARVRENVRYCSTNAKGC